MAIEGSTIAELHFEDRASVEAISEDIDEPMIVVANLYRIERARLEKQATVPAFIPVIASRQVRIKLQRLKHFRHHYVQPAIESNCTDVL